MADGAHALDCRFVRETERAICVVDLETGEELWFPKSTVIEEDRDGGTILVERWIAEQKGLL